MYVLLSRCGENSFKFDLNTEAMGGDWTVMVQ